MNIKNISVSILLLNAFYFSAAQAQVTHENLLDRMLIEDMMINFYWELTDYSGDRDHLDQYYLEEAVMIVNGFEMKGRTAIKNAYETRQNEAVEENSRMVMFLNNPRIRVNGNTATLEAIWTGILNKDLNTEPVVLEQGIEESQLEKTDGVWRIKHRVITSLSNMPDAWDGD